jgi:hypothetical protein
VTLLTAVFDDMQPTDVLPVTLYVLPDRGETTSVLPLTVYVLAPDGTRVKLWPWQMVPLFTLTTGSEKTETAAMAAPEDMQPADEVPVTEYEVPDAGDTVKLLPVTE